MQSSLRTSLWAAVALLGVSVTQGHAALPVNKSKTAVRPATKTATRPVVAKTSAVAKTTTTAHNYAHHHHGSALSNVLHELHHAQQLLHVHTSVAHHHRTKAEAEIAQAIHHLQQHPHHQGSNKTHTAVKKPATAHQGAPAQASLSTVDSKFRQAQKMVHAALHQLHQMQTKGNSEHHHHFHKAIHELKQASHQIQEAMRAVHTLEKQMAAANNS